MDVPVEALAALAEREQAGQLHITLRPEPIWLSDEERDEAGKRIDAALAEAGLVDVRGRVTVDFLDWLPLLVSPAREYYGWVGVDGQTYGVLAAAKGLQAILAVSDGTHVGVQEIDRNRLAESLVEQLPPVGPGGGHPRTVRVADLAEAARRGQEAYPLAPAVADVVSLVQRPVSGSGELYVGRRDDVGRHSCLQQPLHYADTDWGRYLSYTTGSGDDAVIHIGPAGPRELAETLDELAQTLN
ncbi:ESX secretion-associated protein EspG [Amycolatopsis sp. SID8362]|uniref:ESX secretion-associated protein EspG n=1 Tax=Amycolatopsis sp. SID8362 TaxID=2690346 RepID=UPI00136A07C2|nr:ESX secretion-associated protein EspG [Amycolatopsis sp. SID8362]NBH06576.1 ESX secretion-associated protein EspG [Amycolatopsis sp. SID8362]NED43273.1 ESX secretion-associated protein EspG [Amycolatopsis sp. SID8362]